MTQPEKIDLLLTHGVVITVDEKRRIYLDGAVAVKGNRIVGVGPSHKLERSYTTARTIDVRGGVVHPGFIDCHVHLSQHLGRGTIPDIWPEEREHDQWLPYWTHITEDEAYYSAMLACLEMVRNGTTSFGDNGGRFNGELNALAAEKVGLRGAVAEICWDRPPLSKVAVGDTDECLNRLERLVDALPFTPASRVWGGVSIAGMGCCSDRLVVEGKHIADRAGVILDMHQSFGPTDVAAYREHAQGRTATAHLNELGVLGPTTQLVHMIRTEMSEIDILARTGVNVVHCPAASTRVAMGVSRVGHFPEMVNAGINVALGSDSGNYSDFLDVGRQAYLAATIHREARGAMPTITAEQALEMATINGARSLGIANQVGALEPGKKADIVIHAYRRPEWRPGLDAVNSLIYSAQSVAVDMVIVDGDIILEDGHFTRVDEETQYREIDRAARQLYERMGFRIQHRWPVEGGDTP